MGLLHVCVRVYSALIEKKKKGGGRRGGQSRPLGELESACVYRRRGEGVGGKVSKYTHTHTHIRTFHSDDEC